MIYEDRLEAIAEAHGGFMSWKTPASSSFVAFDGLTSTARAYFDKCFDSKVCQQHVLL